MAVHYVTHHSNANFHDYYLELQDWMHHPIAFHAKVMVDIMNYHQAIKQHHAQNFVNAITKEVNGHVEAKCWKLLKHTEVTKGIGVIHSVWAMQCKRNLTTNEVTKHKTGLNIHSEKQQFGKNHFDTYALLWHGLLFISWSFLFCYLAGQCVRLTLFKPIIKHLLKLACIWNCLRA